MASAPEQLESLDSLDGEADTDVDVAWAAEIEQRVLKIEAGETLMVSVDEARRRVHRAARGG